MGQGSQLSNPAAKLGHTVEDLLRQLEALQERERKLKKQLEEKDALARLGLAAEHVGDSIEFTDPNGAIQYVNPAYVALTGYTLEDVLGLTPADVMRSDAHSAAFYEEIWKTTSSGEIWKGLMTSVRKDGSEFTADCTLSPVFGPDGELMAFMCLRRDVTAEVHEKELLRSALSRYALASAGANDGMWGWDLVGEEVLLSARWRQMLGFAAMEFRGPPPEWFGRVHPEDRPALEHGIQAHIRGDTVHIEAEYRIRHIDGGWRWMLCRGLAERDRDGKAVRVAGSQGDITKRKTAELRLRHEALHDALTGLPNRVLFQDRLQQALRRSARQQDRSVAVLFVDLDRFKNVNDSLGHAVGDRLLQEVARRLARGVRSADSVARIGGDEFTVLLDSVGDPSEIDDVARRILEAVRQPIKVGGSELVVSASIGVASSASEDLRPEDLLRDADTAMYRAKSAGRDRTVAFEPTMREEIIGLVRIENELRQGLGRGELMLYYQPIVALPGMRLDGFEALVRWNRPTAGIMPPDSFLHVARDAGLMDRLEDWVLQATCDQVAVWRAGGHIREESHVSVNVSPDRLTNPALMERVQEALDRTGIPPRMLKLEITESSLLQDEHAVASALRDLRALGIRVALDDFGTGYSSLSYIHRFPVDVLKIDRSFISGLPSDSSSEAIVRAILGMASGLGLEVVAEGVETEGQLRRLIELGCDAAQGYYLGRPGGPETVAEEE